MEEIELSSPVLEAIHEHVETNRWTLDDALDFIGVGRFHTNLWCLCGAGFFADGIEKAAISFLYIVAKDVFDVSSLSLGMLGSASNIGLAVGAVFWGTLSDRWGRRFAFNWSLAVSAIFGFLSALVPSFAAFVLARFGISFGIGGTLPVDLSLLIECLPRDMRSRWSGSLYMFFGLGRVFTSSLAWLLLPGSWRAYVAIIAIPSLVCVFLRCGVTESPAFLAKQGDLEGASKLLRRMAYQNSIDLPNFSLELNTFENVSSRGGFTWELHQIFFNLRIWSLWILVGLLFEWSTWILVSLESLSDGDSGQTKRQISTWLILMNGCELVAPLIASVCGILRHEERALLWVPITAGAFVMIYAFLLKCHAPLDLICTFAVVGAYNGIIVWVLLYAFTPKAYPPEIRTTAFGIAMAINRSGSAISPLIAAILFKWQVYGPAIFSAGSSWLFALIAAL